MSSRYGRRVDLMAGSNPAQAVEILTDAARRAGDVLGAGGSALDQLNRYLLWAAQQESQLANLFPTREIEHLLTSRRYWTIQSLDPVSYGGRALSSFVALEVRARIAAFDEAKQSLLTEMAVWLLPSTTQTLPEDLHAVVVDTNVLMRSKGDISTVDWPSLSGTHRTQPLAVAIPAIVVEELDDLKHAHGKMTFDGESHERRWLATLALGWLQRTFPGPEQRALVREAAMDDSGAVEPALYVTLLSDPLNHIPLAKADAEIIDTALRLQSLARSVTLVSYDTHMAFTARRLGLRACIPPEEADLATQSGSA